MEAACADARADGNRACPYHAQLWRACKAPVRPHGGHGFSRVSQHAARGVPRGIDSHTRVPTPPIEPDREPDPAVAEPQSTQPPAEPQSTQPPGGARCGPRTRSHPRSRFALIPRPSPWRALTQPVAHADLPVQPVFVAGTHAPSHKVIPHKNRRAYFCSVVRG